MKNVIVPIFVPHMGCPHACVFCNQYKITGQWQPPSAAILNEKVAAWQRSSGQVPELAFYGGSFTAIALDIQNTLLDTAASLKAKGAISAIRLSTRPDALGTEVLERLRTYDVDTIEIGVQSLHDEVLMASGRGHTAATTISAINRVKAHGFRCGAQMMVALPADTPERSLETCKQVIALKPDLTRIYPTAIIKDTALELMYRQGHYIPWSFDDVVETVAHMVMLLDDADIPVVRIGLQAEDRLTDGDVIAGAYHPALGEYVKARIYRYKMQAMLKPVENGPITFAVPTRRLSQARGQHCDNLKFLRECTGQSVEIVGCDSLMEKEIERR